MEETVWIRETNYEDRLYTFHKISVKEGDSRGGWSRQVLSLSATLRKAAKRFSSFWYRKPDSMEHLTKYHWSSEYELNNLDLPGFRFTIKEHSSVWDFYKAIGYDHKNKSVKQIDKVLLR